MMGACGWCTNSWLPALADVAAAGQRKPKSVILIWLNGGPATIDLWDLKPDHQNGGPFREIATSVSGMKISEHLPTLATMAADFSIIRSMATREGDHARARVLSLTGYTPQGAINFPAIGSLVAHQFNVADDIPSYVHIGGRPTVTGGGFLGPQYAPFVVGGADRRNASPPAGNVTLKVEDLTPDSTSVLSQRLQLQADLQAVTARPTSQVVDALESARERALRLMNPKAAAAFNLDEEDKSVRDAYGEGAVFGGAIEAAQEGEGQVRDASTGRFFTTFSAVQVDRFSGDAGGCEAVEFLVLVHDPGHGLGIGPHIGCGDILIGSEQVMDFVDEATGESFQFFDGQFTDIDADTAFRATVGDIDDGGFPGHE